MRLKILLLLVSLLFLASCSKQNDGSEISEDGFQPSEEFQESLNRWEAYGEAVREHWNSLPNSDYTDLIKKIAREHPRAIEFKNLYPKAYQISGRTTVVLQRPQRSPPELSKDGIAPDRLVFIAPLYGRYEFRCTIPFYLSPDYNTVDEFKEPYYELFYTSVIKQPNSENKFRVRSRNPVIFPWGAIKLDLRNWEKLKAHDYDWEKIEVYLVQDNPIPNYPSLLPKGI